MRRWREVWLLLFVYVILTLGYWVVWQAYLPAWERLYPGEAWRVFLPLPVTLVAWLILSFVLTLRRCRETLLLPVVALLTGIGLLFLQRLEGGAAMQAMQQGLDLSKILVIAAQKHHPAIADLTAIFYRCSDKQLISFVVGWFVLTGTILFWRDYRSLARYKYLIAVGAILLLLVTTIFGRSAGGQTISLNIGPMAFQPHDLVKLLLVIFMAAYLVEKQELLAFSTGRFRILTLMDLRYLSPLIFMWLMMMAIIFKHDDLGAALLLFGALLGMLYLGTGRKSYVILGIVLSIAGVFFGYRVAKMANLGFVHRIDTRIKIWQNPWSDPNEKGFQICQSLMALGNGRVVGAGLAGGYSERIPAIHTDMIYAGLSEDLGLVGAVAIIGLLMVLIGRMFNVALKSADRFGQLLAAGLATTLGLQAWVILAGVMKFIPLTGITLPFISYGGTSLVVNLLLVGIILKVAEERVEQ